MSWADLKLVVGLFGSFSLAPAGTGATVLNEAKDGTIIHIGAP